VTDHILKHLKRGADTPHRAHATRALPQGEWPIWSRLKIAPTRSSGAFLNACSVYAELMLREEFARRTDALS
jgi:hypothetical protein